MLLNIMEILNHHIEILCFYILSLSVGILLSKDKHSRYITKTTTLSKKKNKNKKKLIKKEKL